MKRVFFVVLLAVFFWCSFRVALAEYLWEASTGDQVPEILKQQVSYDEMQWKLARWYNLNLKSDWQEPDFWDAYGDILNLHGGAMGYISVPSKGLWLPIQHGTGVKKGAGHIQSTDFPIGGAGSHCALTGDFFLNTGDCFYIHILGQTRPYRVQETVTLLGDGLAFPSEAQAELCTLVNTGPGGTNYLMQGSYWEDAPREATIRIEEQTDPEGWLAAAYGVLALGMVLVFFGMWCRKSI